MTTELKQTKTKTPRSQKGAMVFLARLVLFWERFWPAILPALAIPFTLTIISLFGLWQFTPDWLHWTSLTLATLAFGMLAWRDLKNIDWPSRKQAQRRMEEDGEVRHAALQALDDHPFNSANGDHVNNTASPLWQAHMNSMKEQARKARLKGVRSSADDRDPYALRFTALGILIVAIIAAGDDWQDRLAMGVTPGAGGDFGKLTADLWIEPPDYTGKAPIYLLRAGENAKPLAEQINVPEGAILIAQLSGGGRAKLDYSTPEQSETATFDRTPASARAEITLTDSGLMRLRMNGREAQWPIGVLEDSAPIVGFVEAPSESDDGRLIVNAYTDDDYGISSGHLVLRLAPDQQRPLDAPDFDGAVLTETRKIELADITGAPGQYEILMDLQSDPWAGLEVLAKISVQDGAGQAGDSDEVTVTLPARTFFNPVAKAVIEQRQTLAVAAGEWRRTARSFDAITLAPEVFFEDTTEYLLLRTAFWRVMRQDGEGFDDAVEKFWPLALQLEDEALELARQRLEAAQEALRQALERGASDQEVERLVDELRQAMNDYLQALAQSGQPTPNGGQQNAQQLNQSDLEDMLNSIQDLAQSGAQNAARQMLSDLENLLNNLRLSQGGQGQGSGQGGPGGPGESGLAGEAGELIGRQRELADESFERGQSFGETGEDLAQDEGGLGEDLDDLIERLQEDPGADPDGDASRSLGRARNAMREAQEALENDDFGAANGAMERAIAELREGAEGLAREQMRQAQDGQTGEGMGRGETDPLGRPVGRANGGNVEVPGESEAGRTRAVIDELRKRLGEQGRDEDEIEYLERLLERF